MFVDRRSTFQKIQLFALLDRLFERLELSSTQLERAKGCYDAVGRWLADGQDASLASSSIYLQGSTALGTTVKPIGRYEHDVDLVCHIPILDASTLPSRCKWLVGERLKAHGYYAGILEEKPRCWRLNYAGEFHLDITPSIRNIQCRNGGELVPDKALRRWMASNPKGYRYAFERRAELVPQMRMLKSMAADRARADADIEPFPERALFKPLLCRIVQIAKRHRDVYFERRDSDLAPISVIVTTLAAWSYEEGVRSSVYDSELDVLTDVIRRMPNFVRHETVNGQLRWVIPNETTAGENFAERWNTEPGRAEAFFGWQRAFVTDLEQLAQTEGLDRLSKGLTAAFGEGVAAGLLNELAEDVSAARRGGNLSFTAGAGLVAAGSMRATPVRANTFYGAR